jgi:hypothetical protein
MQIAAPYSQLTTLAPFPLIRPSATFSPAGRGGEGTAFKRKTPFNAVALNTNATAVLRSGATLCWTVATGLTTRRNPQNKVRR